MRLDGLINVFYDFRVVPLLVAASVLSVSAQITNVTARDPRIDYVGDWVDQDNGGHKFTASLGSSLSFTFQGSAIFWYSSKDPRGGVANVFVDSGDSHIIDASTGTAEDDNPVVEVLFSQTNLHPSKDHTFNVTYIGPGALGGPYVTVYLLAFSSSEDTVLNGNTVTNGVTVTSGNTVTSIAPKSANPVQTTERTQTTSIRTTIVTIAGAQTSTRQLASSATRTSASSSTVSSVSSTRSLLPVNSTSTTLSSTAPAFSFSSSSITSAVAIAGTQSLATPSPSSNNADAVLHATQRLGVILGAVLGSIFGVLLLCTTVLLIVVYRKRKNRLGQQEQVSPFSMREPLVQSPAHTGNGFGGKTQQLATTDVRTSSPTSVETSPRVFGRSPISFSEITGYFGRTSNLESSPPGYTA